MKLIQLFWHPKRRVCEPCWCKVSPSFYGSVCSRQQRNSRRTEIILLLLSHRWTLWNASSGQRKSLGKNWRNTRLIPGLKDIHISTGKSQQSVSAWWQQFSLMSCVWQCLWDRNMTRTVDFGSRTTGSVWKLYKYHGYNCSYSFCPTRHHVVHTHRCGYRASADVHGMLGRKHLQHWALPEDGSDCGDIRNVWSPGWDGSLRNLRFFTAKSSRLLRESRVNTSPPPLVLLRLGMSDRAGDRSQLVG